MGTPMATPLNALPPTPSGAGIATPTPPPADVADVLNEMEQVVRQEEAHRMPAPGPALATMAMPMLPAAPMVPYGAGAGMSASSTAAGFIHMDHAKRAGVAVVLAWMLFYPNGIFPGIYERLPKLGFLESYDFYVRLLLLAVLFYVVLTYVPL